MLLLAIVVVNPGRGALAVQSVIALAIITLVKANTMNLVACTKGESRACRI